MPDTDQQPLTALPAPRRVSRKVVFLLITGVCALVALAIVLVPLLSDDSSGDGVARSPGRWRRRRPARFRTSPSRTPRAAVAGPTWRSQPSPIAPSR